MSRNPLFQVMFVLQDDKDVSIIHNNNLSGIDVSVESVKNLTTKFDLTLFITESAGVLKGRIEYNTDIYETATISRMAGHFNELIRSITKTPEEAVSKLRIITSAEEAELDKFNQTAVQHPNDKTLSMLFEQQVDETPSATAVVFADESLTYTELNQRANKVANYLAKKGISPGDIVPICIERSINMIVGLLGILKAGAGYAPIDPEYPEDRINYMIRDISAAAILTSEQSKNKITDNENTNLISLDGDALMIEKESSSNPGFKQDTNAIAYLLYTSGSTGRPKGVKMPGSALLNLLYWQENDFRNKQRRVLQFSTLNFDVHYLEIFSSICFGSTVYLINEYDRKDVGEIIRQIDKYKLTHLYMPYIVFQTLSEHLLTLKEPVHFIEEVIVAGEQLKLTEEILQVIRKYNMRLVNQYGPTEAHVVSSYDLDRNYTGSSLPPIGKPIDNTTIYIVDKNRQRTPLGVPGELFIGGVQVAYGYLNLPELSAERFIDDFFDLTPGARMYKTGDLARWLPDGNIEFLGRMDDQVKIRGFRVELGEIEAVLQQSDLVNHAVVLARPDKNGQRRLVAYIVPESEYQKDEIITHAKKLLPDYMVPSLWVEMESMPITRNGKVDRRLLPEPDASELLYKEYVAPGNIRETNMANVWAEVLRVEKVGIHDNFFELGGHSLIVMRLISAIRIKVGLEISIRELFSNPTVASLLKHMEACEERTLLPSIEITKKPELIPLSFGQERLWFIDKLEGSVQYHIPAIIRLKGEVDIAALENAFRQVIDRHEILKTVYKELDGHAYQLILNNSWSLGIRNTKGFDDKLALENYIHSLVSHPFDLANDHMLRADLVNLNTDDHVLVVTLHHIAGDGWSVPIIFNEVTGIYNNSFDTPDYKLPRLELQYADYALWQRRNLDEKNLEKALNYWKAKLAGTSPLQLPIDHARPFVQTTNGNILHFALSKETSDRFNKLTQSSGTSVFMSMIAAFKILLHRYTGQTDITVGTAIANRKHHETQNMVGFFVNTLALRTEFSGQESFNTILEKVRTTTFEAFENQDAPFEKVVEAVVEDRDVSRSPLFQVMFVLQNESTAGDDELLQLKGLNASSLTLRHDSAKFELTFFLKPVDNGFQGSIEYNTDLFEKVTIEKLVIHFNNLLQSLVDKPAESVGKLNMLAAEEKTELISRFNPAPTSLPAFTIVDLFEFNAKALPDHIAIVADDSKLTYSQLDAKANQLAHYLIKNGVRNADVIPVCMERSVEIVVAFLAILKAGAAYLPIDPVYPEERIKYMLKDSKAKMILTSKSLAKGLEFPANIDKVEVDAPELTSVYSQQNTGISNSTNGLAYVIYTSGSTGEPKGVMIEHGSLMNLTTWHNEFYAVDDNSKATAMAGIAFDAFGWEIWPYLAVGASVHLVNDEERLSVKSLVNKIKEHGITHSFITTALVPEFINSSANADSSLKYLLTGGDKLSQVDLKGLSYKLVNNYGPTENTIVATSCVLDGSVNYDVPPIGKPVSNTSVYILNAQGELMGMGFPGEICIGGASLARGYLNRPELTAEKFIRHPFDKAEGARLYRTGDLGRWLPDGNIEYLGRIDDQVKIRGYRIELGEIETVLLQSAMVSQAVVVAKQDAQGNRRLVSYVVAGKDFSKEAAKEYLSTRLPEYMVPQIWVELEQLPLTPNGKIDKKALPDPDMTGLSSSTYAEPESATEKELAAVWQTLLGQERVGLNDNFFELGGDSIMTIQVVSRLRRLGYVLQPKDIFIHQTVGRLSKAIAQRAAEAERGEQGLLRGESGLLPIQQWYLERQHAEPSHFNQAVLVGIDKQVEEDILSKAVTTITAQHDALRFSYRKESGGWKQTYGEAKTKLEVKDLGNTGSSAFSEAVAEIAREAHRSLDIERGQLIRVLLIKTPEREKHNRLLIVIHHLAVDGVSWRILIEDFEQLLEGYAKGEEASAGSKTGSYRQWYQGLEEYSKSRSLLLQENYWKQAREVYEPLPVDKSFEGKARIKDNASKSLRLNQAETKQLLQEVPRVYHTEINDILLAALAATLSGWAGKDKVTIGLEGHGRENLPGSVDVSRTVGWFTSLYPVVLDGSKKKTGEANLIKSVKEDLRRVPDKGIGYGVLKYIKGSENLAGKDPWDIVFNYLGQVDNVVRESKWFANAAESSGEVTSPEYQVMENISVNSLVVSGELIMNWTYCTKQYTQQTIDMLANSFIKTLQEIISHCMEQERVGKAVFTPSDFGLSNDVSYQELDEFLQEEEDDENILTF